MRLEYFELVDQVTALSLADKTIEATADVPAESTVFEGHFPGYPLMPGVLLIETMAQTAGWLLVALGGFGSMAFLAAVKEAKMRSFVTPGQQLVVTAKIAHEGSGFGVAEAAASSGGKKVCDARLMFRTAPFPQPDLQRLLQARAVRIGLHALANSDA